MREQSTGGTAGCRLGLSVALLGLALLGAAGARAAECPGGTRLPRPTPPGWQERLSPPPADLGEREQVRIAVFGDSGVPRRFTRVAKGIARACGVAHGCDFALVLGDNFYDHGPREPDPAMLRTFFLKPMAPTGALDAWVVLGNHGYRGCPQYQIDWSFQPFSANAPRWRLPADRYAVPGLPPWLHLFAIDTEQLIDPSHFPSREAFEEAQAGQLGEIRAALCGREGWRLLVGHHPIYTSGHHAADSELGRLRALLTPVIEECAIQSYFSGHDHHQELVDTGTFLQVIEGAASKLRPRGREAVILRGGRRVRSAFFNQYGFALVTLTEELLVLEMFSQDGDLLTHFEGDRPGRTAVPVPARWSFRRDRFERPSDGSANAW